MPHLILEYSSNVREKDDLGSLFPKLHQILVAVGSASLESCKSRAVAHGIYYIGNGEIKNAFVHLEIWLKEGRPLKIREKIGEEMLKTLGLYFSKSLKELDLQITVGLVDYPRNLYFKIPPDTV